MFLLTYIISLLTIQEKIRFETLKQLNLFRNKRKRRCVYFKNVHLLKIADCTENINNRLRNFVRMLWLIYYIYQKYVANTLYIYLSCIHHNALVVS